MVFSNTDADCKRQFLTRRRPPNQYLVASRCIDIRSGGGCILYWIYVFRYM